MSTPEKTLIIKTSTESSILVTVLNDYRSATLEEYKEDAKKIAELIQRHSGLTFGEELTCQLMSKHYLTPKVEITIDGKVYKGVVSPK